MQPKQLFNYEVLQHQRRKSSKTPLCIPFLANAQKNVVFCDVLFKMYRECWCFLHFYHFELSKQTGFREWYLECLTRQTCEKHNWKQMLLFFQFLLHNAKKQQFLFSFLSPFIWIQEHVYRENSQTARNMDILLHKIFARFMYLFMVVLQVCIFFPKTHFGSRGYSFGLLLLLFLGLHELNLSKVYTCFYH